MNWSGHDVKQHGRAKKEIAVATRCSAHYFGAAAAATVGGDSYRYSHVMKTKASAIRLVYANFYPTQTSESSNANALEVASVIEHNGQAMRLHFNGERLKKIDIGGISITDPIEIDIPEETTFYSRTFVKADGGTVPQGIQLDSARGEGKAAGDLIQGTGALAGATAGVEGFGPVAIIGIPEDETARAFILYGDSIIAGSSGGYGWPVEAVEKYGYTIASKSGSTVNSMYFNSGNAYRLRLARFFTDAIVNFGTNDFNGPVVFNTQVGLIQDLWKLLQKGGLNVWQATTMPRSTGTFASLATQTPYNGNSYQDKRALFNYRLRIGFYDVNVLDVSDIVESTRDSGRWVPGSTGDGIHPFSSMETTVGERMALELG